MPPHDTQNNEHKDHMGESKVLWICLSARQLFPQHYELIKMNKKPSIIKKGVLSLYLTTDLAGLYCDAKTMDI